VGHVGGGPGLEPLPEIPHHRRVAVPTFFNHALLARARLDLGLTQDDAAAAAGVDVRTYRRYESGEVNDPALGFAVRHPSRRRILQRLAAELGLAEDDLLVPAPSPPPAPPRPAGHLVRHAHPLARAHHFVGREAVLALLHVWFAGEGARINLPARSSGGVGGALGPPHRDATTYVLAVVALGGAGKTSVVERFLSAIGDGPHPGGVFVWSFYDDARIEALLDQALAYFAPGRAAQPGERLAALEDALRGGGHLLVLDGLEVVQGTGAAGSTFGRVEDAGLRRLLAASARGLARVLCTSRVPLTDLAAWEGAGLLTLRLDALTEAEGLDLLARWGLTGGASELASLCARVGGHALSVAMIGSYAGAFLGGDAARARAIPLEPAARDDLAARRLLSVLSAYAGALPAEERDLVARLALFPAGAPLDVLEALAQAGGGVAGALAGRDRDALARSLARLERLGIVHAARGGDRFATHPFLADYFRSLLGVPPEQIHAVTRASLAARLDAHRAGATETTLLDAYEELLDHTRAAGHVVEAWGIYQRGMGGFRHLGLRLGEMGRALRVVRGFTEGGDPARTAPALPLRTRARVAYELGLYAGALGDLPLALRSYRASNALMREAGSLEGLAVGLRTLAYTQRLTGDLAGALALAGTAVEVSQGTGALAEVVRAVALRASILHDLGRVAEAAAGFAEARSLGDEPTARRGLWEAEHALALGRVAEARAATLRNVEACRDLGWEGHAAHGHTLLGLVALAADPPDTADARRHLAEARRWTAATGEVEVVLRCLDLEARLALAEGATDLAAAVTGEGRRLAEDLGFGLFAARFAAG
jgi:transcriptional regulator with XRE-family HTH domain/tetratricopeptide (TPR) repeat protein